MRKEENTSENKQFQGSGAETLNDLNDQIISVLKSYADYEPAAAEKLSKVIVDQLREYFGGQLIYFPKGKANDVSERDLEMFADFTGNNQKELARKYGMTIQTIYRRLRLAKEQCND